LANEHFLKTCKFVLSSSLPRLYETQDGQTVPVGEVDTIGRSCNVEDIERITEELSAGLEADVLTPMKQWLFAWSTVQGRLKDLTSKRIEMDSRRRQVANLRIKEEKAKSAVDKANNPSSRLKREQELEKVWHIQQHKDGKLSAAVASYESMESEVLEELAGLIRDAVCLKSYLAACTEFQREAFRSISTSLIGVVGAQRTGAGPAQEAGRGVDNPFEKTQANENVPAKKATVSTQYDNGEGSKSNGIKPNPHALYGDDIKLPAPTS